MGKAITIRPGKDLAEWVTKEADKNDISVNLFLSEKLQEIKTRSEGTNK